MNFSDYDLEISTLVIFQQLLKLKSVSQTARHLDLSQPAVSRKLAKLRDHFKDPLFVRTGRGLLPTPLAIELDPFIEEVLNIFQTRFHSYDKFDPEISERKFTIASSEIGHKLLLPLLFKACNEQAPNISLRSTRPATSNLVSDLENGDVDVTLGAYPKLYSGIYEKTLATESYVCGVRKNHSVIDGRITVEQFMASDHIIVSTKGLGHIHRQIEKHLLDYCPKERVKVISDNFVTAALLAEETDCIAMLPARVGEIFGGRLNLQFLDPPINVPDFEIKLYWHERFHQAPANRWLRNLISNVIR